MLIKKNEKFLKKCTKQIFVIKNGFGVKNIKTLVLTSYSMSYTNFHLREQLKLDTFAEMVLIEMLTLQLIGMDPAWKVVLLYEPVYSYNEI